MWNRSALAPQEPAVEELARKLHEKVAAADNVYQPPVDEPAPVYRIMANILLHDTEIRNCLLEKYNDISAL